MNKFICIEGCIGAGKSTLTKMLSDKYESFGLFENFEDNPYLSNFYKDPDNNAFSLELYFMAERFQQQKKLFEHGGLFNNYIFSDYAFVKSLVFAGITLKDDELRLYKMLFHIIYPHIKTPDLILYLHKPVHQLLANIKVRARLYEANIKEDYLNALNQAYLDFLKQMNTNVIILDTSQIDFVKNPNDFEHICNILNQSLEKKINYL